MNRRLIQSGWYGSPLSCVKTRFVSTQAFSPDHCSRSWSCLLFQARRTAADSELMEIVRTLSAFGGSPYTR
ncbi:hypothetical protein [Streptomyces albiflavescens]|uniref:hypothetical protein n=1 Tax=Streptomyces albiflavescens TaxID=1623582 RepID=UPI001E648352|nr:hypothetical protein [Streptomyces albiflavescens]